MPKSTEPLQKHTLNLYLGDMDELRLLYPDAEPTVLIRDVVRALIANARAQGGAEPNLRELKVPINV